RRFFVLELGMIHRLQDEAEHVEVLGRVFSFLPSQRHFDAELFVSTVLMRGQCRGENDKAKEESEEERRHSIDRSE
ncbi:hypothetical protein PFISCL1PPCAC_11239, partial [Pristionchus fissidentatus]